MSSSRQVNDQRARRKLSLFLLPFCTECPVFRRSIREFFGAYREKTGAKGRGIIERDPSILPAIFRAGPSNPPPSTSLSLPSLSLCLPPFSLFLRLFARTRPSPFVLPKQTTPGFSRRGKSYGERATTRAPTREEGPYRK